MGRYSFFFLFMVCFSASGQISPEKLINGSVDKGKWPKVEQSIRKALAKDSLNPEPQYLLSLYYFSPSNPAASLDSAYRYSRTSWSTFRRTSVQNRDRLKRVPLDSMLLVHLGQSIDSAAFDRAKRLNTEIAYQQFIASHQGAREIPAAIELRDEVAFLEALKVNTWTSFQHFMTRYPASHRKAEASKRYDKLLFDDKTRDQRQTSYIRFVQAFPESPYRDISIRIIFELSTATGTSESFRWFIENYPASPWSKTARNILYRMQTPDGENTFDSAWMTDSLRHSEQLNQGYWVPFFKSGLFGFMDSQGAEMIPAMFERISDDYRCGDVHDRMLVTSAGLIARNGAVLWKGKVQEAKELGLGYVMISSDSGNYVIHESGFRIGRTFVQGAQVIANHFIGLQKNKKWAVYSLAGRQLLPFSLDDISVNDSLIVMVKEGKKILTTPDRLGAVVEKPVNRADFVCDDLRRWGRRQYWVRIGVLEGVVDDDLNYVIPLDRQILRKTQFGFLRGKEDLYYIKGIRTLEATPYKSVYEQAGFLRLLTPEGRHYLYDKGFDRLAEGDSIWFQGQLAFLQKDDSVKAFLPSGQKLAFEVGSAFQFKEYKDSSAWIVLEDKKRKSVFDAESGIKLFSMDFDQIEAVGHATFLVTRQGKKGLVGEDGRVILPIEYDAIVAAEHDSFSLLKDKKFGWFDAIRKVLIKPAFERNIKPYNNRLRLAFRDKGYGFLLPDGKPLGTFNWEEVQYWNDSVAWVKKNFQWLLVDIQSQKVKLDRIRNFTVVKDTPAEKLYTVRQDNAFGVVSSKRGVIVPLQYSDIVNLGNQDVPLYFTERHIEEAGISVVVYYDQHGKIIRKQALEAEEFEKIYCDN